MLKMSYFYEESQIFEFIWLLIFTARNAGEMESQSVEWSIFGVINSNLSKNITVYALRKRHALKDFRLYKGFSEETNLRNSEQL